MVKIVYNGCFGGFSLSEKAVQRYCEITGKQLHHIGRDTVRRDDPALVQVVEELGRRANTRFSELAIEELPEGTKYRIVEREGMESVDTPDSYEWKIAGGK